MGDIRLVLVRHGQTTSNVGQNLDTAAPGADLTDLGREQAMALPAALGGVGIETLYAPNLVRTQQTAAPLARELGLDASELYAKLNLGTLLMKLGKTEEGAAWIRSGAEGGDRKSEKVLKRMKKKE
ncbi:histidine phosphatase family protein [Arthrobacter sp. KK5.5]|uniref:histidine phosphatase family protein n=1 Tax=Arthrobacter sp. KK5.5 TaxID=3373084 RepID=UPI003EE68851